MHLPLKVQNMQEERLMKINNTHICLCILFGPDRVLGIRDIEIKASGTVKLRIWMSKTDQFGFGTNIEITPSEESFMLNELLSEYLRVRPNFQGHLFCQPILRE
jgi:hypothetical protein